MRDTVLRVTYLYILSDQWVYRYNRYDNTSKRYALTYNIT